MLLGVPSYREDLGKLVNAKKKDGPRIPYLEKKKVMLMVKYLKKLLERFPFKYKDRTPVICRSKSF